MVMLLVNQLTQSCIPRPPFSTRWSGLWPYGQAIGTPPAPRRHTLRGQADPVLPSLGCTDQVGQVCLPMFDPGLLHTVAVTDQTPLPVVDEGRKGCFRPGRLNHIEGDGVTGHHPQSVQGPGERPGRLIDLAEHVGKCSVSHSHKDT
jgi:hypothetical protein